MSIEVTNEPAPAPRASGTRMRGGCHIQLVEAETGKSVSEVFTPEYIYQNERRLREERKY